MTNDANDAKVQYYENEWRRAAAREYWLRAALEELEQRLGAAQVEWTEAGDRIQADVQSMLHYVREALRRE
ncbi:MAG TPA: hypothetical protein DCQ64_23845 [Candidatus Rokubacteria bacterium]|nr:hypothetical protein [Candidatus Rokubacteria bacterium]